MAEPVVVGVVGARGPMADLAEQVAADLPRALEQGFPGVEWRAEAVTVEPQPPSAPAGELVDLVRRSLLSRGWELAVGLTDLPLRSGRRPVSAHASATHGVGLVSVPALGPIRVPRRVTVAVVRLVEGLVGEGGGRDGRTRRIAGRLRELASPLGRARVHDDGSIRFVSATLRGNLRLLGGMVRANQPSQLIARLSTALVGALGTAALSLASADIWRLSDGMSWPQLVALSLLSIVATVVALILAHGLWERSDGPEERERVVLFNLATCATLGLGVLAVYAALFVIAAAAGTAFVPDGVLDRALGHPVDVTEKLRLAWLAASLATVGGALGSLVEDDTAVRDASYRVRAG
jgi:hypothetical protein